MTNAPKRQPIPFGKYLLLDRINIGGMAEVWRGKMFGAGGFERLVAIKRILPSIAEDEEFITMFIDEAKISVQLTHANIGQIYELGNIQSSYFIAMEYIPGKDMRAIFERCRKKGEPAPIPLTCYVIGKLCEGLDYAHRKKDGMGRDMNIVHRDVSPQNVLISYEGEVKVIDFGIAKAAGKATKTQAGILKGKFGYMSPEQIRGLPLDRRSDVFAIGVCLYEMLTGERLFVGESDFSVLEKVRKVDILPPTTYNRRIPDALEKIVLKALAKEVEDRYQYANEVADDLQRFLITSESIFSRKDLMAYMKATFAEEVEREKIRIQEYADIKAPEGMQQASENDLIARASLGGAAATPSRPSLAAVPPSGSRPSFGGAAADRTAPPAITPTSPSSSYGNAPTAMTPLRRPASGGGIPKLTAAAAVSQAVLDSEGGKTVSQEPLDDDGGGRTILNNPEIEAAQRALRREFQDAPEPATMPGQMPRDLLNPGAPFAGPGARAAAQPNNNRREVVRLDPPAETLPPRARLERPTAVNPSISAASTGTSMSSDQDRGGGKTKWLLLALALLAVLGAGGAAYLFRQPSEGFVVVDVLDPSARARARINVNGQDLGAITAWPRLQKTKAGPAVVMVTCEGYKPYVLTVDVKEGAHPTIVNADLQPLVQNADLFVLTEPDDAEIRLDGQVVKRAGSSDLYTGRIPVGEEHVVEARMEDYAPAVQNVTADSPQPKRLILRLQRSEFSVTVVSEPSGATITAGGRPLGVTPALVKLAGGTRSVTLTKRCYEPAEVPVEPAADPAGTLQVRRALNRQPSCR